MRKTLLLVFLGTFIGASFTIIVLNSITHGFEQLTNAVCPKQLLGLTLDGYLEQTFSGYFYNESFPTIFQSPDGKVLLVVEQNDYVLANKAQYDVTFRYNYVLISCQDTSHPNVNILGEIVKIESHQPWFSISWDK